MMTVDEMIQEAQTLEGRLRGQKLIDPQGSASIHNALSQLYEARSTRAPTWTFQIDRDAPLSFRETNPDYVKHKMKIDVYGMISQPNNGLPSGKHSIGVRVWCVDKNVWFNPDLDASDLETAIDTGLGRRVMLRFRFDYASRDVDEPWFHLQIGGQQRSSEFYRMPDNLGAPRFLHHPMNLVMACEFVVKHFYPEEYGSFIREPGVCHVVRVAQRAYLRRFLDRMKSYPDDCKPSYLDHMWSDG